MPKYESADPQYTKALNDALKSIYRVYGADLSAFFRDARDQPEEPLAQPRYESHVQVHAAAPTHAQRRARIKAR